MIEFSMEIMLWLVFLTLKYIRAKPALYSKDDLPPLRSNTLADVHQATGSLSYHGKAMRSLFYFLIMGSMDVHRLV